MDGANTFKAVAVESKGGYVGHMQDIVATQLVLGVVVEVECGADGVDAIGQGRQRGDHVVSLKRHIALNRHGMARNKLQLALVQPVFLQHVVGNAIDLDGERVGILDIGFHSDAVAR